jgi:hypothetical protein
MQKLRYLVDQSENFSQTLTLPLSLLIFTDQPYDLLDADWDVHVISGALKLFFRELREPLIPFSFFNKFMDANSEFDQCC